ncbi:unnamed protein product [Peniophora sp. CBMAI 1063]|nr:unnamed protein product [Peniophora sp. CBMAI 1063]
MPHDKRARFLGRRARAVLENGEENTEWELNSVRSHSTRSSAGSTDSAGSCSDSSSDEETVNDDETEVGDTDEEATRSRTGDVSLGDAMEIDTVGWNEDAETPATQVGGRVRTSIASPSTFASATAVVALQDGRLDPTQDAEYLGPPTRSNFEITITPSPTPGPPIVLVLAKPTASEPVASISPLVSPSASVALDPSISPVSSVRSGLVERPRPLRMAGSIEILKRSLSAISIGQSQPKAAEIGTEKPVLNEEGTDTRLGARGSSSQNQLGGDEDAKSQCSEKSAERVTPTPTQTGFLPPEPSQTWQSATIPLARLAASSSAERTLEEVSLTETSGCKPDAAANETCATPTPLPSVEDREFHIAMHASTIVESTSVDQTGDMSSAFTGLWDDLAILVREMQELSIAIEKGAEAGRMQKTATSGAQVSKKPSIHKVREVPVVADAFNAQPVMNEGRGAPITLATLEAASRSVREKPEITLRGSSKASGLTKGIVKMARSQEIQSEQPSDRFWKDDHIGQWVATSAIPSEKTRSNLLTRV